MMKMILKPPGKAIKLGILSFFIPLSVLAQSNQVPSTNRPGTNSESVAWALKVEEIRANCIQNRRRICGKILKVLPDGLVVDSGYTNLLGHQPNGSWLIDHSVAAEKAANIIEENQPGAICIGQVFLTDLPPAPRKKPKVYDYVNLEAFPAGKYDYQSVGTVSRTVRKFSCKLSKSVQFTLDEADSKNPSNK